MRRMLASGGTRKPTDIASHQSGASWIPIPGRHLIQDGVEVLGFEQLHLLSIKSYERELFFKQRSIRDNIQLFNFSETDPTLHADSHETAILYEMKVKLEEIRVLLAKYCMYLRTEKLDRRY